MVRRDLRDRIKSSPLARVAVLPARLCQVARHDAQVLKQSLRWVATSREHENFTYGLTAANREHLAWFVSNLAGVTIAQVRGYLDEIYNDQALRAHLESRARAGTQPGLADAQVFYGRRVGWYALVRAVQPEHVVETGTDKGLGACVLAAALLKNGHGRLTTIDVDSAAGHLLAPPYSDVTDLRIADSLATISTLSQVDFFLHDSDHVEAHERGELDGVTHALSSRAWVLSDNSHWSHELAAWAERNGRPFLFFDERPEDHWYPGGGIGVSPPR